MCLFKTTENIYDLIPVEIVNTNDTNGQYFPMNNIKCNYQITKMMQIISLQIINLF
jgi:hypothetical protein